MSRGQRIAVRRETVVVFLGSTPRGPVSIPVTIRSVNEYLARFGSPDYSDRLRVLLAQFFDNGGTKAIVVRVSQSSRYSRLSLAGPSGPLILEAINPGPWESLRASIDYDHISDADTDRFNLVIHRMTSPTVHIVEEQEIFTAISVKPEDSDYLGHALMNSVLVRPCGAPPAARPANALHLGVEAAASYVYAGTEWAPDEALTDYDMVGSDSEGTGLFALDLLPIVDLVCMVPDADRDIGPVALFMAERYCRKRNAFLLMDPPSQWNSIEAVQKNCRELEFYSPNVMTYFPRLANKGQQGDVSCTSVLGAIAGRLAAEDAVDGISAPDRQDSVVLRCRPGLELSLSDADCVMLARNGINALQRARPGHIQMSGLVTFARGIELAADWNDLRKRRSVLFIVESIARGTRWAAFDENAEETWAEIRQQVENFLQALYEQGALSGVTPKASFYVFCDSETNRLSRSIAGSDQKIELKSLTFCVGFTLQGAGDVAFRFVHDAFECRVDELGWQPGIALAS
jgi:hypothetical protein